MKGDRGMKYKVGDKVKVLDGSYSAGVCKAGFKHMSGIELRNRGFVVRAVDVKIPAMNYSNVFDPDEQSAFDGPAINDLLLQSIDTGEFVFVRSQQVKLIPPEPKPVPFMEAVEAYGEGKVIRVEQNGGYTEFSPCGLKDPYFPSLRTETILHGTWYIVGK